MLEQGSTPDSLSTDGWAGRVNEGRDRMGLKAPGIITFLFTIILTVTVLIVKFFDAKIPFIENREFWVLLFSHLILILGCLMRGL
jgi:hypothetical protein